MALRMTTSSRALGAQRLRGSRSVMRCPAVIVRADRDGKNVVTQVTEKLQNSKLAEGARGAEANQREQWEKPKPEENIILPAFTRNREINVGRLAMLGFFAGYIGEIVTPQHLGFIGQVSGYTGLSNGTVGAVAISLILANLLGGLLPFSSTWDDDVKADTAKRNPGPTQGNTGDSPKAFFSITSLGFTKQNELFTGRVAQLGFLAGLAGEVASGRGPIGQVAKYFDWTINDDLYAGARTFIILFSLSMLASAAVTGYWGQKVANDDAIY